jgi:trehalose 6-phosphate phosphatase
MSGSAAILAEPHIDTLNWFALSNILLAFDYDGTLAPIAQTPGAARMREATRQLLARVAQLYPCVVISGRALGDLERRLEGIPLWSLMGNHGLEHATDTADSTAGTGWSEVLRRRLPAVPGLIVEDKGHSITIHYRKVDDKAGVRRQIHEAILELPDVRTVAGIEAISLLPRDGGHKGTALQEARRQFACDTALYVGDDETDEDAFRSGGSTDLLSVRVGSAAHTAARFCLQDQNEIDPLLQSLIRVRDERRRSTFLPRMQRPDA